MKLIIKSRQDYGTFTEEHDEVFECTKKELDEGIIVEFENGNILITDKKIIYSRGENEMRIEEGRITECDFNTEHGLMVLDIEGLSVEKTGDVTGTLVKAQYKIKIGGVEPYTNEIEIIVEQKLKVTGFLE